MDVNKSRKELYRTNKERNKSAKYSTRNLESLTSGTAAGGCTLGI